MVPYDVVRSIDQVWNGQLPFSKSSDDDHRAPSTNKIANHLKGERLRRKNLWQAIERRRRVWQVFGDEEPFGYEPDVSDVRDDRSQLPVPIGASATVRKTRVEEWNRPIRRKTQALAPFDHVFGTQKILFVIQADSRVESEQDDTRPLGIPEIGLGQEIEPKAVVLTSLCQQITTCRVCS